MSVRSKVAIVLPFISSSGGGVTEVARLHAEKLCERGIFDIEIICFRSVHDDTARKLWPNIPIHTFPGYGPKSYMFSPGMVLHLLRNEYDVVHVHGIWMFHVLAGWLGTSQSRSLIITPHGMLEPYILQRSVIKKFLVSNLYQKRVLRKANFIQALTEEEAMQIRKYSKNCAVRVIPNFVTQTGATGYPEWWRPEMNDRTVVLFLARIHEKKGWRPLLDAWTSICRENSNLSENYWLVFCGWLDDAPDFEDKIRAAFAECNNVSYVGPQFGHEKERTFNSAHIFALPSKSEGLPMAVLEAAAAQCMLMISKACNVPEFSSECSIDCGTSENEISESLMRVSRMPRDYVSEMGRKAQVISLSKFSQSRVIDELEDIYRQSIMNREPRAR